MKAAAEAKINETIKTIYSRRAVRKYKKKSVDPEFILQLIEAGRMAPSAMNRQPWHFYVISGSKRIKELSQAILQESKLKMLKAGIKDVIHSLRHPGDFHLKDAKDFFKGEDPIFHGAPVVIFITSDVGNEWSKLDIGMCAQNIMLAAKSLGLDTCPVGLAKFIENTSKYHSLNIPLSEEIELAVIVGYGDEQPNVHERKKDNLTISDALA